MRTNTHVTETRSIKKLLNILPDAWVVRELTERDYGTDLIVEVFGPFQEKDSYYSTGSILNIQLKGTTQGVRVLQPGDVISFNLKTSFLKYALKFPTPFILILVDLTKPAEEGVYFLWLQRYVFEVLDEENQDWYTSAQNTITVRIPVQNTLPDNVSKLEKIAYFLPKLEQWVKYNEIYTLLESELRALAYGQFDNSQTSLNHLKAQLKKVMRLDVLLNNNYCCVSCLEFKELLELLEDCQRSNDYSSLSSFPHYDNMRMLAESINSIHSTDVFIAENEDEVVY